MPVLVAFRTLTQFNFSLELNEDQTIGDVKALVAAERGTDYAPELQKLIYYGEILDDATKVGEVGFDSSKFVVVMTLAKRKAPEPAAPTSAPVAEPADATAPTPAPVAEAAAPAASAARVGDEFLTPEQKEIVTAITEMGFDRERLVATLRSAYDDPDLGLVYLFNGIPDDILDQEPALDLEALNFDNIEDDANEELSMLANMPQLAEIRSMIQQNPEMLAAALPQLASLDKDMAQTIQNSQQAFMDILNGIGQNTPQDGGGGGITGIGYDRERIVATLRSTFDDPDLAIEFLLNRILDDIVDQDPALGLEALNVDHNEDDANEDLNRLANMPQLAEIRSRIQQNPEMLAAALPQLASLNKNLLQSIQNSLQAFMDILKGVGQNAPQDGGGDGAGGENQRNC